MGLLAYLIDVAVQIYIFIIIVQVAMSWLLAFEIVNAGNRQAQNLIRLLKKATDPVYKPLRKYVPPIGGIDISPLIVMIGLSILRNVLIGAIMSI